MSDDTLTSALKFAAAIGILKNLQNNLDSIGE
jgi:hypothetical protein